MVQKCYYITLFIEEELVLTTLYAGSLLRGSLPRGPAPPKGHKINLRGHKIIIIIHKMGEEREICIFSF